MAFEMLPFAGFLLLLLTCNAHAQSDLTVLLPDSVQPGNTSTIVFYREGENGYYGNNVTVRTTYLPDSANKSWFDEEIILPGGTLRKFYFMAHSYNQLDNSSIRIRLQIWRPVNVTTFRYMLVWQQLVQVAASAQVPMLYTYTINQNVTLVAGDRIGWAFEGKAGPISFQYAESHRTRVQSSPVPFLPSVGQTVGFDPVYLPSIFSVSVSVDAILPPDSVQPGNTSTIVFYSEGENGYYGNNVTVRTTSLTDLANKSFFDEDTLLPGGTLRKFYFMAHSYNQLDNTSTRIRLKIWRPVNVTTFRYMLVWQQLVQVAASAQVPMLYTYTINQNVTLVAGDRIGWTFEGKAGPISFQYAESHRTRVKSASDPFLPSVGQTVDFDPVYLPSIFSVAVSVDSITSGINGTMPSSIADTAVVPTSSCLTTTLLIGLAILHVYMYV